MDPSVLFFVRVAAEEFILESDVDIESAPLISVCQTYLDFTGNTRVHVTHHVVELVRSRRTAGLSSRIRPQTALSGSVYVQLKLASRDIRTCNLRTAGDRPQP